MPGRVANQTRCLGSSSWSFLPVARHWAFRIVGTGRDAGETICAPQARSIWERKPAAALTQT